MADTEKQKASPLPDDFSWVEELDKIKPKNEKVISRTIGAIMMAIGVGTILAAIGIHAIETPFLIVGGVGFVIIGFGAARGKL